ncbi:hypothetical protein ADIS_3605 [Lunatimonas lonarensis]|uniref:Uncharacterized protein n=1 Tax=Lunatimonas lonarensis TaxID=1232681 RepID=R7ZP84_9BACT|nr:hypothetical protein ADIS_3605 [Lunatimonas lonarensis]
MTPELPKESLYEPDALPFGNSTRTAQTKKLSSDSLLFFGYR